MPSRQAQNPLQRITVGGGPTVILPGTIREQWATSFDIVIALGGMVADHTEYLVPSRPITLTITVTRLPSKAS
jgi:hypothetical protein